MSRYGFPENSSEEYRNEQYSNIKTRENKDKKINQEELTSLRLLAAVNQPGWGTFQCQPPIAVLRWGSRAIQNNAGKPHSGQGRRHAVLVSPLGSAQSPKWNLQLPCSPRRRRRRRRRVAPSPQARTLPWLGRHKTHRPLFTGRVLLCGGSLGFGVSAWEEQNLAQHQLSLQGVLGLGRIW